MKENFYFKEENLSCCSVELHWTDKNKEQNSNNSYKYELYKQNEIIYKGKNTSFGVNDLKPNETYSFTIKIMKTEKAIYDKKIYITTLNRPNAILSENSIKIANDDNILYKNKLLEPQNQIIGNSSKLIFNQIDKNLIKGNFDGIEIKITHEEVTNIYYISFDITDDYFDSFFDKFIEESNNNIMIPCHFIIQKLPTILIFNLLEKGSVILTGKRMGGVIASSLAFYILYIGKTLKKKYGNIFEEKERNCIGVVTFGSPSFLNNLADAIYMMGFTSYFYNIKNEFDYFPGIVDFLNKVPNSEKLKLINIFKKINLEPQDNEIIINNIIYIKNNLNESTKIPFGFYYKIDSFDFSLDSIYEIEFDKYYYFQSFNPNDLLTDFKIYENLKSQIKFSKESLQYLENKNYSIDYIKIIRRYIMPDVNKGIIKFKLIKFDNNIISPDVINQIKLCSYGKLGEYDIKYEDIYYDNDSEITAYIDELDHNIDEAIITNNFGGVIRAKHIINIQGSGSTRKMIRENIEKLFLFPFFKLFEIFYYSYGASDNNEEYNKLKQEMFGDNFDQIKILDSFQNQIEALNDLLFFSRPDILARSENEFIQMYVKNDLTDDQKKHLNNKLESYYKKALELQKALNVNCLNSEVNSIANKIGFPQNNNNNDVKKLFMCYNKYFEYLNVASQKFDDSYIKKFFIEELIKESLQIIEKKNDY